MSRLAHLCLSVLLLASLAGCSTPGGHPDEAEVRTWEMHQLVFHAENPYNNPYTQVDV